MSVVSILFALLTIPGVMTLFEVNLDGYCTYILRVDCTTSSHKPICGSDGIKYRNKCSLAQAHCRNSTLQEASKDHCTDATTTHIPTSAFPTFPKSSCSQILQKAQCDTAGDKICGSNGITYANICEFAYAFCTNTTIHKAHDGQCIDGMSTPGPVNNLALIDQFCKDIPDGACDNRGPTVCGSNGVIYANMCHLSIAHCKNTTIYKAHNDYCVHVTATDNPIQGSLAILDSFCAYIKGTQCGIRGPKVCGSDGVTYINMCELARAHCQNYTIQQAHGDHCPGISSTPDPIDSSLSLIDGACKTLLLIQCGSKGPTVCGSNDVTYANIGGIN